MTYLIVYNHNTSFSPADIHECITKFQGIMDWWHYLPNVYIVTTTTRTSKDIANIISSRFPVLLFFVVKVDLNDNNGVLNKGAWEWINNKVKGVLRIKPVQHPKGLKDLFSTPPPNPLATRIQTGSKAIDDILNKLK